MTTEEKIEKAKLATDPEPETETTAPESVHIITELSQAARMIEYVESTCFNHEDYGNILTSEQCNELHAMFDQLDEIISNIKK